MSLENAEVVERMPALRFSPDVLAASSRLPHDARAAAGRAERGG